VAAPKPDLKLKGTLIKVDPEKGTTYEDYAAICKALGVKPKPPSEPPETEAPAD
jgi:hypothetical protein